MNGDSGSKNILLRTAHCTSGSMFLCNDSRASHVWGGHIVPAPQQDVTTSRVSVQNYMYSQWEAHGPFSEIVRKRPYQERGCKVFEKTADHFKMNFFLWSTNPFFHCFCSCKVLIFNIATNLAFSVSFDPLIGLACVSSKTHNRQAIFSPYLVLKPCMFCQESLGL